MPQIFLQAATITNLLLQSRAGSEGTNKCSVYQHDLETWSSHLRVQGNRYSVLKGGYCARAPHPPTFGLRLIALGHTPK